LARRRPKKGLVIGYTRVNKSGPGGIKNPGTCQIPKTLKERGKRALQGILEGSQKG